MNLLLPRLYPFTEPELIKLVFPLVEKPCRGSNSTPAFKGPFI